MGFVSLRISARTRVDIRGTLAVSMNDDGKFTNSGISTRVRNSRNRSRVTVWSKADGRVEGDTGRRGNVGRRNRGGRRSDTISEGTGSQAKEGTGLG